MAKQNPKEKEKRSIHHKYRISVINEDSFEEVRRARLSVFNILMFVVASLLVSSAIVVFIIFYTPVREYVPGYPDSETSTVMVQNAIMVDSLLEKIEQQELYLTGIKQVLQGEVPIELFSDSSALRNKEVIMERARLEASEEEMEFRSQVEAEEQYNLGLLDKVAEKRQESVALYLPVRGMITSCFDIEKGHLGLDLATAPNEHILAVANGTVISVDYSITTGNTIVIQHSNNIISICRHALSISKKAGEKVKAGEVIGIVGNTGTLSTGTHLHLEIWKDGEPIDPESLIAF